MQTIERSCEHCGKHFQPRRKDQKYCGKQCRANSSYSRLHRSSMGDRRCLQCGESLPPESRRNTTFCSSRCRQRYHYERRKGYVDTSRNAEEIDINESVEQTPPSPLLTGTPVSEAQINALCEQAERRDYITVDYDTLNSLMEDPPKFITDEIKACFQAHPTYTVITASYFESEDVESLIPQVISALDKLGSLPAWEFGGDFVFIVSDRCPENRALPVRKILLKESGGRSVRLRRGKAWGLNDWKLNKYMYIYHELPEGWDMEWWTG